MDGNYWCCFRFVGAAASGIKTFITKSANVFRAGTKDVIRAAENEVHLGADSIRVGEREIASVRNGRTVINSERGEFEEIGMAREQNNVLFNAEGLTLRNAEDATSSEVSSAEVVVRNVEGGETS